MGKETKKERKVLAAPTNYHIFGYHKIKKTKTIKHEAMILKTKLLSGEISDFNPKDRMTVDFFPGSVQNDCGKLLEKQMYRSGTWKTHES